MITGKAWAEDRAAEAGPGGAGVLSTKLVRLPADLYVASCRSQQDRSISVRKDEDKKKEKRNFNRQELLEQLITRTGYSPMMIGTVLRTALDTIMETVAKGDKVSLTGFGVFSLRVRKGREGVDPRTFERIMIDEVKVPHFKPGQSFKEAVRQSCEGASSGEEEEE